MKKLMPLLLALLLVLAGGGLLPSLKKGRTSAT